MFADRTLLILGAGASFEAGLPIGETLKEKISDALEVQSVSGGYDTKFRIHDEAIDRAIRYSIREGKEWWNQKSAFDACTQISAALPLARSIDNYLHSHKESKQIELCGKLGIVRCILNAEAKSRMQLEASRSAKERLNFSNLNGTWYNRFASLLFESTYEELQEKLNQLTVIVFNYDRCFEHFMYYAIITHYGVAPLEAAKLVKSMAIYHPYGTVGNLPWMEKQPQSQFGQDVDEYQLLQLAGNIKTYTEGVDRESSEIQAIHTAVRKAKTVTILGFGFIPLNMSLLQPNEVIKPHSDNSTEKIYYATAYGMSDRDRDYVNHSLGNLVPAGDVEMNINNKLTCAELFTEYAFSLGLS